MQRRCSRESASAVSALARRPWSESNDYTMRTALRDAGVDFAAGAAGSAAISAGLSSQAAVALKLGRAAPPPLSMVPQQEPRWVRRRRR